MTELRRELGVFGAVMMGLGAILGTGVFVSMGLAAGIAGPWVLVAIAIAAGLALCNGMSSAQLAGAHPVSGGTYEYGYEYLSPVLGFVAGWMFLSAKSASAATAALGCAGAIMLVAGLEPNALFMTAGGAGVLVLMTGIALSGIKRSALMNSIIVSVTVCTLLVFIIAGAIALQRVGGVWSNLRGDSVSDAFQVSALLHATALAFVAYTGYGRIATLGEEVHDPRRVIPIAIFVTLAVSMLLYLGVTTIAVASVGSPRYAELVAQTGAPLLDVAELFKMPLVKPVVAIGAVTAMLGVLLNLILGLSRVALAMGRRRDFPPATARITPGTATPSTAVVVIALIILAILLIGDIGIAWSFSAVTVLIYYAITNLAALRLPAEHRRFPRLFAVMGLVGCLGLGVFVDPQIWVAVGILIVVGLGWKFVLARAWS